MGLTLGLFGKEMHLLIGGIELCIVETFTEEQWVSKFRMRRETFEFLCPKLEPTLAAEEKHVKQPLGFKMKTVMKIILLSKNIFCIEFIV